MDIVSFIKNLRQKVNDLNSSIETFKKIYSLYEPIEWIDNDLLFNF